jgi:hypothetical protein
MLRVTMPQRYQTGTDHPRQRGSRIYHHGAEHEHGRVRAAHVEGLARQPGARGAGEVMDRVRGTEDTPGDREAIELGDQGRRERRGREERQAEEEAKT